MSIIPKYSFQIILLLKLSHYYSSSPEGGAHAPSLPPQSLHPLAFPITSGKPDRELHTGFERLQDGNPARKPLQMFSTAFVYSFLLIMCQTWCIIWGYINEFNNNFPKFLPKQKTVLMELTFIVIGMTDSKQVDKNIEHDFRHKMMNS